MFFGVEAEAGPAEIRWNSLFELLMQGFSCTWCPHETDKQYTPEWKQTEGARSSEKSDVQQCISW